MPVLRLFFAVLLLLFCMVPLGKPLGIVLCFGADGHTALEPVHDRVHRTAAPTRSGLPHQQGVRGLVGVEHVDPCVDVTFFASESDGQLIRVSDTCPKPEPPVFVSVLPITPVCTERPAPSILHYHSLSRNHPLTILQSVVLHI
jgi:hypothetical protein